MAPAAAFGVAAVLGFQGVAGGSGPGASETKAPGEARGKAKAYGAAAGQPGKAKTEVDRLALKPEGSGEAVLAQQDTDLFGLLGVSWTDPEARVNGAIEARSRSSETGKWSRWITLDPVQPGLDGKRLGAPGATEPVWVGPSNAAEVRVKGGAALPAGLTLNLVDPGTAGAATKKGEPPAQPAALATEALPPGPNSTAPQPPVVTRVEWQADESLNDEAPGYLPGGSVKAAFVHHTASAQPYDCSQSAAIVRGIHEYHVKVELWRDLGYNFLIDKCGTIFEGRKGGIDQPVQGAHTLGWNAESMGIAVLGDHQTAQRLKIAKVNGTVPEPGAAATFVPVPPKRLMDTRAGLGVPKAKVGAQGVVTLPGRSASTTTTVRSI
ncbi:N-acetylmuramoyl-L-alanine amidase [Streptomyces sp. NPDC058289]|uniref:N-acetylmuramoyl-L-alanine amidase n=1 Tax=Streptomyces sp. NPDC058289 TaxID=3346425 RepID=UPI0036E618F4